MINVSTDPIFQLPEMLDIRATLHTLDRQVVLCAQAYHRNRSNDERVLGRLDRNYAAATSAFNCVERAMWNRYRQIVEDVAKGRKLEPIPFS